MSKKTLLKKARPFILLLLFTLLVGTVSAEPSTPDQVKSTFVEACTEERAAIADARPSEIEEVITAYDTCVANAVVSAYADGTLEAGESDASDGVVEVDKLSVLILSPENISDSIKVTFNGQSKGTITYSATNGWHYDGASFGIAVRVDTASNPQVPYLLLNRNSVADWMSWNSVNWGDYDPVKPTGIVEEISILD